MSSNSPERAGVRTKTAAILAASTIVLTACSETQQFDFGDLFSPKDSEVESVTRATPPTTEIVEREVEAPEVFAAAEPGLWDGRPTFGGIWVSYPDVKAPERVIIRNANNGSHVIGALFRHETATPGPRIRVSSDAADALGMLPGSPAEMEVVALKIEQITVEPPEPELPIATAAVLPTADTGTAQEESADTAGSIETQDLDPIAAAAAALDMEDTSVSTGTEASSEGQEPQVVSEATEDQAEDPLIGAMAALAGVANRSDEPTDTTTRSARLAQPFLQVGMFAKKDNADRTADVLRNAGIVPTVKELERDNKTFWRVLAGPVQNNRDQRYLKTALRKQGYADAYPVTN